MNHNTKKTNAGVFVLAVEFTIEVAGAHVEEPQDPSTRKRFGLFREGSEKLEAATVSRATMMI